MNRKFKATFFFILLSVFIYSEAAQIKILAVKEIPLKNPEARPFFFKPTVIISAHQDLFIAESGDNRIRVYDSQGEPKYTIGKKGQGPNEFDNLIGLDILGDRIYAADSFNNMIKIFSQDGKYLGGFKTPFKPIYVAVLSQDKILVTNRPLPLKPEKMVFCFNSRGELQWKAIDPVPAKDQIFYTLINEIMLKKDEAGHAYIIWKYQNKYILKIDGHGQVIEKIGLDQNYPVKSINLPLKEEKKIITSVCWNWALSDNKFYLIPPVYTEDGDIGPGKDIMVINDRGSISAFIKLPQALRLLTVNKDIIYGIDTDDELHIYQLEDK
ncbi:MAG: 6-bladed beta-propeller [Candidatus Saccharicenans sp.]